MGYGTAETPSGVIHDETGRPIVSAFWLSTGQPVASPTACAYLLVQPDPQHDPSVIQDMKTLALGPGSAPPPRPAPRNPCRPRGGTNRYQITVRAITPLRRSRSAGFIVGQHVRARLDRPLPAGCSVRWSVSGTPGRFPGVPTAVAAYDPLAIHTAASTTVPGATDYNLPQPVQATFLPNPYINNELDFYLTGAAAACVNNQHRCARGSPYGTGQVVLSAEVFEGSDPTKKTLARTTTPPLVVRAPQMTDAEEGKTCTLGLTNNTFNGKLDVPDYIFGLNDRCRGPGIRWHISVRVPAGGAGVIALNQLLTKKQITTTGGHVCWTGFNAQETNPVADSGPSDPGLLYTERVQGAGAPYVSADSPSMSLGRVPGSGVNPGA